MRSREAAGIRPGTVLTRLWVALGIAALSLAIPGATPASDRPAIVVRPEGDLLLLALRIDQLDLDLTLPGYPGVVSTLVPLGALARGLEIAIQVDPATGVAQGFVLDERRRFRLRAAADTAWLDGAPRSFARSQVEWHPDDVYVDARLLAEWLPLDLVVDRRACTLTIHPREPLPIQRRLERELVARRVVADAEPVVLGERLAAPYRLWGWPASDHTLHLYRQGSSIGARGGLQFASNVTGDLLYQEAHGFVAGDDRNPTRDVRLSMGRRDPDPVLLGPLRAREIMAGDVMDPGLELVSVASAGKGVLLSSFPLFEETTFDRRTFQGDLPPGWDVELYRNDALIGYQQAGSGSRYEFADVPMLYGLNHFRLQFYGPQGQTRTEVRTAHLGRSLMPQGRICYRVMAQERADETWSGHAEFSTGITRQLSVSGRVAGLEDEGGARPYEGVGVRVGWDRLFVKTDAMLDDTRGSVLQAALATRVGNLGLWAQHAWLNDFRSEVFRPVLGSILGRTGVRVDLELRRAGWPRLPTSLEWRHDDLASGSVHELVHEVSVAGRGVALSNRLHSRFVRLDGASPPVERRGTLLINPGLRRVRLRGAVEYGLERGGELRDVSLSAETHRLGPLLSAEIRRTVHTRETSGRLTVTREYGSLGVSLRSDVSSASGGGVSVLLTASLDRDPRTRQWHLDARPRSESGAVTAQVFLDGNGNGLRDPGEDPLEGVRVRATPGGTEARTGADGVAMLRGFPSGYRSDVGLVTSSLEDPLKIPRRSDVAILPRAGSPLLVDFPVVVCGEIAGMVYLRSAGADRPLAGARLELIAQADGSVVKRGRSAFDGYYDIAAIPPGRYRLRAIPPGPPRPDVEPATIAFEIGPDGPILESMDLVLVARPPQIAGEDER